MGVPVAESVRMADRMLTRQLCHSEKEAVTAKNDLHTNPGDAKIVVVAVWMWTDQIGFHARPDPLAVRINPRIPNFVHRSEGRPYVLQPDTCFDDV